MHQRLRHGQGSPLWMERARGPYGRWVLFIHYINVLSIFWLVSVKLEWLFHRSPMGLIFSSSMGSCAAGRAQSTAGLQAGGLHFTERSSLELEEVQGIARSIRALHYVSLELLKPLCPTTSPPVAEVPVGGCQGEEVPAAQAAHGQGDSVCERELFLSCKGWVSEWEGSQLGFFVN